MSVIVKEVCPVCGGDAGTRSVMASNRRWFSVCDSCAVVFPASRIVTGKHFFAEMGRDGIWQIYDTAKVSADNDSSWVFSVVNQADAVKLIAEFDRVRDEHLGIAR